jgi:hypothetical protein
VKINLHALGLDYATRRIIKHGGYFHHLHGLSLILHLGHFMANFGQAPQRKIDVRLPCLPFHDDKPVFMPD